jgi:diguanylate cyclase (GGDEF)-like protein
MMDQGKNHSVSEKERRLIYLQSLISAMNVIAIRLMDIVLSLFGLLLLSPLFLVLGLLIKKDTPGPVFYRGMRAGRKGIPFHIYKFRTMYERPESYSGPKVTAQDDDRITHLGKWLRDTKLNELPQLWNVLIGDMSIVGPRPEDPQIAKDWPEVIRKELLSVRPGITSPASVLYRNEEELLKSKDVMDRYLMDILPSKLRFDQLYVRNRTLVTDLDVIMLTGVALIPRLKRYSVPEHLLYWGPLSVFIHRYVSWFFIDLVFSLVAVGTAGVIWRLDDPLNLGLGLALGIALVMALLFSMINALAGLNRIQWSRARAIDGLDLAVSTGLVTVALFLLNLLWKPYPLLPRAMVVVAGAFSFFGFIGARYRSRLITGLFGRWVRFRMGAIRSLDERALIVGTGDAADFAAWLLQKGNFARAFSIVGMVDDDPRKLGTQIDGHRIICQTKDIPAIVEKYDIGLILFAMSDEDREEQERTLAICSSMPSRLVMISDLLDTLKVHFPASELEKDQMLGKVLRNSSIDKLTGVWNRTQFLKLAEVEFPRAKRYGRPLSIILITLGFKGLDHQEQVNGDENQILKWVAECCKQNTRQIDILGRYEEDEFVLLLPETDLTAAQFVAKRLRKSIGMRSSEFQNQHGNFQVQVHVCPARDEFTDVTSLVNFARQRVSQTTLPIATHEIYK